ncbi:Myb/SANT-like DNA-binding domain protein [Thalictrum thalictroides]|uniref:Myb/SANT-like DNA-binding domain protein n=1 Tax=Thalictrum thalictroides TaxID=46969 RepID=A0A7J6VJ86_THATH|nr:Myb/SANT-like DNA-binding domain protein [Thalictrum thalictroides]
MTGSNQHSQPPFELANETQANWSQPQELFFINLMADKAIVKGNKGSCILFSKVEWLEMRKQYYYKWGLNHNLKAFKNKMTGLKERFQEFKKLVEESSGLSWDPVLKTVVASHSWWDEYLKKNPKAKRFRNEGCPEYEKLELIFGDTIAVTNLEVTTDHNASFTYREDGLNERISENILIPSKPSHTVVSGRISKENETRVDMQDQNRSRSRSPINSTRHESRDSGGSELCDALKKMAEVSQARAAMTNKYTISECMTILDAMAADVEDRTYMRALKLLQEKGWREAFICMPLARRKGWLQSIEDGDI